MISRIDVNTNVKNNPSFKAKIKDNETAMDLYNHYKNQGKEDTFIKMVELIDKNLPEDEVLTFESEHILGRICLELLIKSDKREEPLFQKSSESALKPLAAEFENIAIHSMFKK